MEIEFFVPPADADEWFEHWVEACWNWFIDLGIDPAHMRRYDVPNEDARTTQRAPSTSSTSSASPASSGASSWASPTAPTTT